MKELGGLLAGFAGLRGVLRRQFRQRPVEGIALRDVVGQRDWRGRHNPAMQMIAPALEAVKVDVVVWQGGVLCGPF